MTNPSWTSGDDYATTVLGNAWDMSSSSDIQLTGLDNLTNVSFSGGVLHATNTNADPIVTLLYNTNNSVPIDTSRFRYLTLRLQVDGAYDLVAGSVARVIWSSQVSSPADHLAGHHRGPRDEQLHGGFGATLDSPGWRARTGWRQ